MSDHKGVRLVLDALPQATRLIADRGYDSAWLREELKARGIEPCEHVLDPVALPVPPAGSSG